MQVTSLCELVKMGLLINLCDFYLCILAFNALQHMVQKKFMRYKFM